MRGAIILRVVMVFCMVLIFNVFSYASDTIKFETDPQQLIDVRYRLFKTENIWTFLELDTQTGRLWQVQFTVDKEANRAKIPINLNPMAPEGKNGRFTLYPTNNMWNFLLVDQESGLIFQAQFSIENENRGIFPILSDEEITAILENPPEKHE